MNVFTWLTNLFSGRGQALSLYHRGMKKAHRHDHQGAVQDYTALLALKATPADVRAMTLYNRALVFVAAGDEQSGANDLHAVLAMHESAVNVRTMSKQKLARMETRLQKRDAS